AEQGKEKGKHAGQGKQTQQVQTQPTGKHGRRAQGAHSASQFDSTGATTGFKAGRHAQRHKISSEQANVSGVQSGKVRGTGRKAEVKQFNFSNTRRSNIQSVTFNENHRIVGAEHWSGDRYVVFRDYHPLWHDRVWWGEHYPRVVLIGGGWYYWNAGWWYPAWGYDPGANFYAYDGPIYAYNDLPPDQVVANVQQELQQQGYYHGEVDGLLGPLTRAALADYQRDHDLYTTAAIDEPTMSSLGFEGAESQSG